MNTFWGSARINHTASVHAWYRDPNEFNGSQCVEEWFSCYFFLLRERVFWVVFLCFEILQYIFPVLPLRVPGFSKELDYVEHRSIQG